MRKKFLNQFSVSRQNNEQSEKEIKKIIPFTITPKKDKISRNKFNKKGTRSVY